MSTATVTNASFPWCETSPPLSSLVAFYWATHSLWLFNIIVSIIGTYQMFRHKEEHTSHLFKCLWILIAFLFCLSPPGFAFGYQAGWECWYDFFGWEAITMIGVVAYLYGLCILNLFFIMRLKTVFASSALKLKWFTLLLLYICVFIQSITPIFICYFFLLGWNKHVRLWGLRLFSLFTYTNAISSTLVLVVFVRKIVLLPKLNQKKRIKTKFLNAILKYMICAVCATLSTCSVASFGIWRSQPQFNRDIFLRGFHIFSMVCDCSVNLMCLYLQFPVGKRLYKAICGRLHGCCLKRCCIRIFEVEDLADFVDQFDNSRKQSANVTNSEISTCTTKSVQITVVSPQPTQ
eukprot:17278_1